MSETPKEPPKETPSAAPAGAAAAAGAPPTDAKAPDATGAAPAAGVPAAEAEPVPFKEKLLAKVHALRDKLKDRLKSKKKGATDSNNGSSPVSIGTLVTSVFSPDKETRRMGFIFLAGVFGLILVTMVGTRRYLYLRHLHRHELSRAEVERKKLGEFFEKQADEARERASWIELGRFTIEALPFVDHTRHPSHLGVPHGIADLQLTAKCLDPATREFIEARMVQARNEITGALAGLDKEDLLSTEGKRRIKKKIVDRMNAWIQTEMPKGQVDDVFFTSLVIS